MFNIFCTHNFSRLSYSNISMPGLAYPKVISFTITPQLNNLGGQYGGVLGVK